ncbi:MAG: hydrogenase formation protein HypD [Candidatus Woesearchaeota archaeon]
MLENKDIIENHLKKINELSYKLNRQITLMEVCGGHTNVIMKYGIRDILPKNIKLISGPGCPVCVTSQKDIDCAIELAFSGIIIATYGDMLKVPGSYMNLEEAKAKTGNIIEIYSTTDVLELKKEFERKNKEIVFFGVGFETTAPMTSYLLKNNVCVYSVHKIMPPALKFLVSHEKLKIDGFISPGHVSTIIGKTAYEDLKIPQVITGFSPEQILRGIVILIELILENKKIVFNAYPEVVKDNGNEVAKKLLEETFYVVDSEWRGIGIIEKSGLEVKNYKLNAKIKYKDILKNVKISEEKECLTCKVDLINSTNMNLNEEKPRCGEVLLGLIQPKECPLYKVKCTPLTPRGACMVSEEGSCAIAFRYDN